MENRKGFTLVELLAVIVILGLLAVLIVPKVRQSVKDARNSSNMDSAFNLVRTADNYYLEQKSMLRIFDGCSYDFTNNVNTCDDFEFSGAKPEIGKINISRSGKVEMAIKLDDKCYIKEEQDNNVVAYDYDVDTCVVSEPVTLSVGDVIRMTPSLNSYTTDPDMTGYSAETINPQELNIWRVISVNADGTYDAVSEYVSSVGVHFVGTTGYKNYIWYLNVLASKYENSDFTVGSRYLGYDAQTEYLTDTSAFDGTKNTTNWRGTFGSDASYNELYESQGHGDLSWDELYLIQSIYDIYGRVGGARAYKVGTTEDTSYWFASRIFSWNSDIQFYFCGAIIKSNGAYTYESSCLRGYQSGWSDYSPAFSLRPVVVLKSSLVAKGKGTLDSPYVLKADV